MYPGDRISSIETVVQVPVGDAGTVPWPDDTGRVLMVAPVVGWAMVEPEVVERDAMTVVGLRVRYEGDESVFQDLWETFGERWGEFEPFAASDDAFGVVTEFDPETETFAYVVGVATTSTADLPADFETVEVPAGTYAVFETALATFQDDYDAVTGEWLPDSPYDRRDAPEFERYGPGFDPTGEGAYEYFLPIR